MGNVNIINKKFLVFFIFFLCFSLNFLYSLSFKNSFSDFKYKNKNFSYINSLILNNEFEEAEKRLFFLLDKNYNKKFCFLILGNLYIRKGDYNLARRNYKKALEKFKKKDIKIFLYKQIINTFDTYKNLYDIIKILNEAIMNECLDTELLLLASFFYNTLFMDDKSLYFLNKAYIMEPNNLLVNSNLIDFYNKNLDYEKAIFHFDKIRNIYPNFYDKNLILAEICFKKNEIKKSYTLCQEISKKIINYNLFLLMGNIFYLEKNYNKAIEMYKKSFMLLKNNYFFNLKYSKYLQNSNLNIVEISENSMFDDYINLLINLYILAKKTKNSLLLQNILKEIQKNNISIINDNIKNLDFIFQS